MLLSPPPPQKDLYPETKRDRYQRGRGAQSSKRQDEERGGSRKGRGGGGIVRITEEREKYLPPTLQEVNLGCSYPKAAKSIDWRLPVN